MKKRFLDDSDLEGAKLVYDEGFTKVIKLSDGSILKIFSPDIIAASKEVGADIEGKVLSARYIDNSPEILVPTSAVYSKHRGFVGYTTDEVIGEDYNVYNSKFTIEERCDLHNYAINHSKLEAVLRRNPDIVFPDFCTCSNIIFTKYGNIRFIDYDGLQVGGYKSYSFSSTLGDIESLFFNPKYCYDGSFNKELDKKSSIFLYFLVTFNVNLSKVGTVNPATSEFITLDDCFRTINLDDPDLCHKTWKIFQNDQENDFLGDTVYSVADKYDMHVYGQMGKCYLKTLVKRR